MSVLMPHQKTVVDQIRDVLIHKGICLLAGETRSGKSLCALAVGLGLKGPVLFVTKKKAIGSVEGDLARLGGGDVTVINSESLHKVEQRLWALVVVDECHHGVSGYPRPSKAWKAVKRQISASGAYVLLMSGTAAIESKAQLFYEFALGGSRGPWGRYRDFYSWWHHPGHYKDGRTCGGYGVVGATKKTGRGGPAWSAGEVTDYSQVRECRVDKDLEGYVVTMTREDAGHKVLEATVLPVELENEELAKLIRKVKRDKVVEVGGETYAFDKGPAQVLQACHMIAGGTMPVGDGSAMRLPDEFDPMYRVRWIAEGIRPGRSYVVLTHYVEERAFVEEGLRDMGVDVIGSLEWLEYVGTGVFVGSLGSLAEGVDMSWLTGSMILYSLSFSGSKFSQVCDRQLKFNRVSPAKVAVPLLKGGVDSAVLGAVRMKKNYNATMFKEWRG